MKSREAAILVLALVGGVGLSSAQQLEALQGKPVVLSNCPIRPLHEVRVPVRVPGILSQIVVKEGSVVKEGDVLAKIDDRLAQNELAAKKAAAENDAPVFTAVEKEKEATNQLADAKKLYDKRIISQEEYRVKEAQLGIARFGVDDAKARQALSLIEQRGAEQQVALHQVVSPIDGIVVQQVRQQGEAVQALDPILRVIRTDVVKVEGTVSIRNADRVKKGMTIDVYPNVTVGETLLLRGHTNAVRAVRVLGDGRRCVSAGEEGAVIIWDVIQGAQEKVLADNDGPVNCLATSKLNPNLLATGGFDRVLRVYDLATGKVTQSIETAGGQIHSAVLHPTDANLCVTGHEDRRIRVWNLRDRENVMTLTGHTNYVTSLAMTPDGQTLLSAGSDQTVRLWNLKTGEQIREFRGRSGGVNQVGLAPDGKTFLFNNYSHLQIRSVPEGIPVGGFDTTSGNFADVAVFSPVPGLVLTASEQRQLQLWQQGLEGQFPHIVRTFEGHTDPITSVDFSPDGTYAVSGSEDRTVRVWQVPSPDRVKKERVRGVIEFVNQQVEAGSQTMALYAEVPNPENLLTPGTFATIVVYPVQGQVQANN